MIFATDAGSILSVVTGVLLVAMGVYIWIAAPRRRQNTALAVFAAGFGMNVITGWIMSPQAPFVMAFTIVTAFVFSPIVAIAGLNLARDFAGREEPEVERRRLAWVLALALLPLAPAVLLGVPTNDIDGWPDGAVARWIAGIMIGSQTLMFAAIVVLLMLAALRYPLLARDRPQDANAVLLLTFGLGSYLAVVYTFPPSPSFLSLDGWRGTMQFGWIILINATNLFLAILWLRNTAKSPPPFAARARWAAWTILTFMLAAFILPYLNDSVWSEQSLAARGILTSIARFLAVATFAFAILRNQLLGIDVKLRWTMSRSTVAAAFVAVFFMASEGAQIFFGRGNEWVGLFAAGAFVFAIAPLQRAAERLAERAVPLASHAGVATAATRGADSFRRAVRLALKDRTLTHDEELDLATVAHDLGLTGPEATRIRFEVERDVRTGGAAASST